MNRPKFYPAYTLFSLTYLDEDEKNLGDIEEGVSHINSCMDYYREEITTAVRDGIYNKYRFKIYLSPGSRSMDQFETDIVGASNELNKHTAETGFTFTPYGASYDKYNGQMFYQLDLTWEKRNK